MNVPYTASPSRGLTVGLTIAIAALAAILLATFWVGFIASDDLFYIKGAYGWLEQFPFVGKSHWELRHTMTLPLAALIKTFGLHEWVLGVPTVLAFFSFLAINAYFTTRFLNGAVATVATVLMLMAPGITVVATYLIPDVPEMLIVTTAFWLLVAAREEDRGNWAWVAIGALCGLGYLNRQTAAVLPVFAALLFLFKPGVPRSRYLVGGLAFVLVAGGEWLYLTLMTGDPLYRTRIDFTHDPITRTMELAHAKGGLFDGDGNIAVNVFIDPVLNLVISQKYPLLFWLAVPSAIAARPRDDDGAGLRPGGLLLRRRQPQAAAGEALFHAGGLGHGPDRRLGLGLCMEPGPAQAGNCGLGAGRAGWRGRSFG